MARFITRHPDHSQAKSGEKIVTSVLIEQSLLARQSHHALNDQMIEDNPLSQGRQIARLGAQTSSNIPQGVDQNILRSLIHILPGGVQRILYPAMINIQHIREKPIE